MKWQFSGSTPFVAIAIEMGLIFIRHRPIFFAPDEL